MTEEKQAYIEAHRKWAKNEHRSVRSEAMRWELAAKAKLAQARWILAAPGDQTEERARWAILEAQTFAAEARRWKKKI